MMECIEADDICAILAGDYRAALRALEEQPPDCLVLGSNPLEGLDPLADRLGGREPYGKLPAVVYGDHRDDDFGPWKRLSDVCTLRRARSPERLLDLTSFFLHRPISVLPKEQQKWLIDLHHSNKPLVGKRVLIVDDDIRNIFALSAILEEHEMSIVSADNGRDAVRIVRERSDIDIVLMDIMMPEMDGLETMREIRKHSSLHNLPIVAVTAKAMKGDREKCLEAGAWDYLAKPVNAEQLLAVLRAWLHR
jgi:CheY-like chemotaxis protein